MYVDCMYTVFGSVYTVQPSKVLGRMEFITRPHPKSLKWSSLIRKICIEWFDEKNRKKMSDTNGFGHNRVHSSEIEDTIVAQNIGREQFEDDDLDEEGSVVSSIVDR